MRRDATLIAEGTRHQGTDAITRFYREGAFHFGDLLPHPRSFRVEGNRVVVEIDLHIAGTSSAVVDTFEIVDGRIRSLVIEGLSDQVRSRLAELTGDRAPVATGRARCSGAGSAWSWPRRGGAVRGASTPAMAAGSTTTTASNSNPLTSGAATTVTALVIPSWSSVPTSLMISGTGDHGGQMLRRHHQADQMAVARPV